MISNIKNSEKTLSIIIMIVFLISFIGFIWTIILINKSIEITPDMATISELSPMERDSIIINKMNKAKAKMLYSLVGFALVGVLHYARRISKM